MMSPKPDKDALKQLRQERKEWIDRARQSVKEQNAITKAIKAQLGKEAGTVPEIAQALKMRTEDVLLFISAMRKYGEVVEGPKDGDYFKYQLAE
jgi:DNA-directed RNA polymerase specialized sigma subunit